MNLAHAVVKRESKLILLKASRYLLRKSRDIRGR